jgi:chromosome segregation ATPase
MEGFLGADKLTQAQSEIAYLKKQVALKSDLIAKLSDDLYGKEAAEKENIQRLAALEKTLRETDASGNKEALGQVDELTKSLTSMRSADSLLRAEIKSQEIAFERLKLEADSAKRFAETLSQQLQERFESEARAMEKAQKLEQDLRVKEITEKEQQAKIDSLNRVLAKAKDGKKVTEEIQALEKELSIRKQEQLLQSEHAQLQNQKIQALKEQNLLMQQSADSLARMAESSKEENKDLNKKLAESDVRIGKYESMIDSLQRMASEISNEEKQALGELDSLKRALAEVEEADQTLRVQINTQENELLKLQEERDEARKNMVALERATTKQQEQAHELMFRLNGLAQKESAAQLEVSNLRNALKQSEYREDSTRQSVNELVEQIAEREASIAVLSKQIESKENELKQTRNEQFETMNALEKARKQQDKSNVKIDSLQQIIASRQSDASSLEQDINHLQKQILTSHQKQQDYKSRAEELESLLVNARLSNDLTFEELKGDVEAMRQERDKYKNASQNAEQRIKQLEDDLAESKRNEESAIAFAEAIRDGNGKESKTPKNNASNLYYAVQIHSSAHSVDIKQYFTGLQDVSAYQENGQYRYIQGKDATFTQAIERKNKLKSQGYTTAFVVAFLDGERISLKDALEKSN